MEGNDFDTDLCINVSKIGDDSRISNEILPFERRYKSQACFRILRSRFQRKNR